MRESKIRQATSKGRKKTGRELLLKSIGVEELFEDGSIQIDKKTCKGSECQLCIKACPTNALYWKMGEVGLVDDLCIYCISCVLSCIVDGCIVVKRKRNDCTVESFSTPSETLALLRNVSNDKRVAAASKILFGDEAACDTTGKTTSR